MPPMDDDASAIYSQERERDAALEEEALLEADFQELLAQKAPAAPTPSEAPAAAAPASDVQNDTPTPDEAPVVPEQVPNQEIQPAPHDEPQTETTTRSILTHARNAAVGEGADIVDNALFVVADGLEALGFEGVDDFKRDAEGNRIGILRPLFDQAAGVPDSTSEQLAAGVAGQLAYIIPAMRLVRGAKVFGNAKKTKWAAEYLGAPSVVAGATLGSQEGNLSNMAVDQGGVFDNAITRALAIEADDSTIERMVKGAVEDVALGGAFEGLGAIIGFGVRRIRKYRKATDHIEEVVENTGRQADGELAGAVDDMVSAREQVAQMDAAVDMIADGRKGVNEAAERAAYTEVPEAAASREGLTPDQGALLDEIETATHAKAAEARKLLAESEARVITAAETTPGDGRWIEALRRASDDPELGSKAVNKALAKAADAAHKVEPPKTRVIDNFLEVKEDDFKLMKTLYEEGDLDEVARVLGKVMDNKNYARITSEDGGVEPMLKAFAQMFGNSKRGSRGSFQTLTFADTEEQALAMVAKVADEKGASLETVIAGLDDLMPDLDDVTVKFNALRMAEMSLAEQFNSIAMKQGTAEWNDQMRGELMRSGTILANLNDRISGISTSAGRLLNSHNIVAKADEFTSTLESARRLRADQVNGIIDMHGGRANIDRIAEAARMGGDATTTARIIDSAFSGATLGDTFYNAFVTNILSGPGTQAVNFSSNMGKIFLWNMPMGFVEAGAVSIRNQNLDAFKQWNRYVRATMRSGSAALGIGGAWRDSTVRQAWNSGRRITAGDAVKFGQEIGQHGESLLRRNAVGDLVRRGVPMHVPFSGLSKGGPKVVKPLFALPDGVRNGMADYITSRNGMGAKVWDFTARVMEIPGRALAAGDELAAAMNYHGTLEANALDAVQKMGLEGAEADNMLKRLIRDAPHVEQIAKRADLTDVDRQLYVKQLDRLNVGAQDAARRGTFTEPPDTATEKFLELRQVIPALRWMAPFVRTPMNLLKAGVKDMNPIGQGAQALASAGRNGIDSRETIEATARFAATSAVFAAVYQGVESGRITGGGPHNFDERAAWLESFGPDGTKNVPYSINIPGLGRIAYNRFDPLAMPIGMLSDLLFVMERSEDGGAVDNDLIPEAYGVIMETLKSRSYMEGLSNFIHMAEDPSRYGRRMVVSNVENTIVPGSRFWSSLERGGLPIPDDLVANLSDEGATGLLKDFVTGRPDKPNIQDEQPGLSGMFLQLGSTIQADLPAGGNEALELLWNKVIGSMGGPELSQSPDRSFFGDVRTTLPTIGPRLASPFVTGDPNAPLRPVANELTRLGYGISTKRMFGEVNGVKLTPAQQDKFQRYFAIPKNQPTIEEYLSRKMFESDGVTPKSSWANLGDSVEGANGGKLQRVTKWVGQRKRKALRKLRREDPDLDAVLSRVEDNAKDRRKQSGVETIEARTNAGEDTSTSDTFKATRVDDPFDGALE